MTFRLPTDEPGLHVLERLVESAARLCAAVDDRHDMARAEGGRFQLPADVRDLRRHVEDARYMGLLR